MYFKLDFCQIFFKVLFNRMEISSFFVIFFIFSTLLISIFKPHHRIFVLIASKDIFLLFHFFILNPNLVQLYDFIIYIFFLNSQNRTFHFKAYFNTDSFYLSMIISLPLYSSLHFIINTFFFSFAQYVYLYSKHTYTK